MRSSRPLPEWPRPTTRRHRVRRLTLRRMRRSSCSSLARHRPLEPPRTRLPRTHHSPLNRRRHLRRRSHGHRRPRRRQTTSRGRTPSPQPPNRPHWRLTAPRMRPRARPHRGRSRSRAPSQRPRRALAHSMSSPAHPLPEAACRPSRWTMLTRSRGRARGGRRGFRLRACGRAGTRRDAARAVGGARCCAGGRGGARLGAAGRDRAGARGGDTQMRRGGTRRGSLAGHGNASRTGAFAGAGPFFARRAGAFAVAHGRAFAVTRFGVCVVLAFRRCGPGPVFGECAVEGRRTRWKGGPGRSPGGGLGRGRWRRRRRHRECEVHTSAPVAVVGWDWR